MEGRDWLSSGNKRGQDERGGTADSGAHLRKDSGQHRRRAQCQAFSEILSLQEFKVAYYWSPPL